LLAARKLQLTEVPVIVLDHLSDAQKRAYVIADNQLALNAGWDEELLRVELAALQDEEFNLGLIGFEDEELARLLAAQDAGEGLTDEDAVPDLPAVPVSRMGDLWSLGDHRLLVGDATQHTDVTKLMAGDNADLVFTDPPYNVDYEGLHRRETQDQRRSHVGGRVPRILEDAFRSYRAIVKPGSSLYVCTHLPGNASSRTLWRRRGSTFAVRLYGPKTRSHGLRPPQVSARADLLLPRG
jgi:hypothetical protein